MGSRHVFVIGAGVAGTAAAWAAARAGAKVSVFSDRAGASALYSGALDLEPWHVSGQAEERALAEDRLLADAEVRAFADALGVFRLGRSLLATREGVVRPALGADSALLDLGPLAGRRVGVFDVERDDWDAALLARGFGASRFAERTGTTFVPVVIKMLRAGHERRISAYDLAALHDGEARLAALAEALHAARAGVDAFLSGPWLGLEPATARALAASVGVPVGETTSKLGGVAGARFERARDRLFGALGIAFSTGRVATVAARGERCVVGMGGAEAPGGERELECDGVVLATGGVAAGGIVFTWDPERGRRGFELGLAAPVELELDGERLTGFGSLYGVTLEGSGLDVLDRVGIAARAGGNLVAIGTDGARLAAAGDCLAGRPRTALRAVLDGLSAGGAVARD
jgi:anaerobic glycerol-3-phosphate dehydrogenase